MHNKGTIQTKNLRRRSSRKRDLWILLLTVSPAIQRSVVGLRRRETEMLLRKARSENLGEGTKGEESKKEKKKVK